ncbi:uncharacterized protein LOC135636711 isoform X2 [Musa acuminata AAA Group]|uniref:uncharacterized protein LOC135636711 isoform X2 n=1 Tax=Musa acuminata AAA Group TaxID=214697 RepID=UPI0031D8F82B
MSAAAIACSRGAAALGFRCRSLMRLPAAQVGCPRSNLSLLQRFSSQLVKSNGSRACLIDTLALVRRLEKEGVPSKQAEAITSTITEVLNESLESVAQSFVSKPEMQRSEMIQDSNLWKFKLEMKGSQILADRRTSTAGQIPANVNKEDATLHSQPHAHQPAQHSVDEFFGKKFRKNARVVASGVARNLNKVGNYIKENIDDILYPYRKPPK